MRSALRTPLLLPIAEPTQVGEARRLAVGVAERLGFDETRRGELAIVVTEAANNLVRHAGGGELVLRPLDRDSALGLELLAIDRGPGIPNLASALRDGFSTGGTAGTGLGAIRRLSAEFDLYSVARGQVPAVTSSANPPPTPGTVLMARLWATHDPPPLPPGGVEVGVVCLPKPGEEACGDAWRVLADGTGRWAVLVADGLGHGPAAATASGQAVRLFEDHARTAAGAAAVIQVLHAGLRGTRGAAVAVADLSGDRRLLRFCGVGNIAALVVGAAADGGPPRNLVSHNGTVGAQARRVQEFAEPVEPGALVVMHSDGLGTGWQLAGYPGLRNKHPAVIAGVLYRDHRKLRDDVTVLVARVGGPQGAGGSLGAAASAPAGGSPA